LSEFDLTAPPLSAKLESGDIILPNKYVIRCQAINQRPIFKCRYAAEQFHKIFQSSSSSTTFRAPSAYAPARSRLAPKAWANPDRISKLTK